MSSVLNSAPGGRRVSLAIRYIVGALVVLAFIVPLLWMISGSFKPDSEVFTSPPQLLPQHVDTNNYNDAVDYISFWTYLRNSGRFQPFIATRTSSSISA
jgi:multiple sugar transport system permease protein